MSFCSYHNHSLYSDGKSSIEEIVSEAFAHKLDEVGISDHYFLFPRELDLNLSLPSKAAPTVADLGKYVDEIERTRALWEGKIKIRIGIEADYFYQTSDLLKSNLSRHPFDYVIGSIHFVDGFAVDWNSSQWFALADEEKERVILEYWRRIEHMAQSRLFDIAGHIDVYKKFAPLPAFDPKKLILKALDAIAANQVVLELNTSGWSAPCQECYPSEWILVEALKREIPFVISADAHSACNVARDFEKAYALLHSLGKPKFVKFFQRQRN